MCTHAHMQAYAVALYIGTLSPLLVIYKPGPASAVNLLHLHAHQPHIHAATYRALHRPRCAIHP